MIRSSRCLFKNLQSSPQKYDLSEKVFTETLKDKVIDLFRKVRKEKNANGEIRVFQKEKLVGKVLIESKEIRFFYKQKKEIGNCQVRGVKFTFDSFADLTSGVIVLVNKCKSKQIDEVKQLKKSIKDFIQSTQKVNDTALDLLASRNQVTQIHEEKKFFTGGYHEFDLIEEETPALENSLKFLKDFQNRLGSLKIYERRIFRDIQIEESLVKSKK